MKKGGGFRARHLVLIYTPRGAHSRIFVTGGGSNRVTNAGQRKILFSGRPTCITCSANEAKTQELMVDVTTNNEPRRAALSLEHEANEEKRRRANPEKEAQRKQQKCDIRKQKQQPRLVHTHRSRASSKSTAGGAKHRTQELST